MIEFLHHATNCHGEWVVLLGALGGGLTASLAWGRARIRVLARTVRRQGARRSQRRAARRACADAGLGPEAALRDPDLPLLD